VVKHIQTYSNKGRFIGRGGSLHLRGGKIRVNSALRRGTEYLSGGDGSNSGSRGTPLRQCIHHDAVDDADLGEGPHRTQRGLEADTKKWSGTTSPPPQNRHHGRWPSTEIEQSTQARVHNKPRYKNQPSNKKKPVRPAGLPITKWSEKNWTLAEHQGREEHQTLCSALKLRSKKANRGGK